MALRLQATPRIGGGSAFFVRHHGAHLENPKVRSIRCRRSDCSSRQSVSADVHAIFIFLGSILFGLCFGWIGAVFQRTGEAIRRYQEEHRLFHARGSRDHFCFAEFVAFIVMTLMPNQSPEPTAVGAVRSAVAVRVASRRWLSFFR